MKKIKFWTAIIDAESGLQLIYRRSKPELIDYFIDFDPIDPELNRSIVWNLIEHGVFDNDNDLRIVIEKGSV